MKIEIIDKNLEEKFNSMDNNVKDILFMDNDIILNTPLLFQNNLQNKNINTLFCCGKNKYDLSLYFKLNSLANNIEVAEIDIALTTLSQSNNDAYIFLTRNSLEEIKQYTKKRTK